MLDNISLNFNWIDVLIISIVIRVVYVGMHSKLVLEIFRLFGSIAAIFVTLHYYIRAGDLLREYTFIPDDISNLFAFILLWITITIMFIFIGNSWGLLLKAKEYPFIDKWGGCFFSLLRSILVSSLVFMLIFCSGNFYAGRMANRSFTGRYLIDIPPMIYMFFYGSVVEEYFPRERLNAGAFDLRSLGRDNTKEKKN